MYHRRETHAKPWLYLSERGSYESAGERPLALHPRARHQGSERGWEPRVEGAGCCSVCEEDAGGGVLSEGRGDGVAGLGAARGPGFKSRQPDFPKQRQNHEPALGHRRAPPVLPRASDGVATEYGQLILRVKLP